MIAIKNDCEGFQFSRARSSGKGLIAMDPLLIFLEEQKQKDSNKRVRRVLIRGCSAHAHERSYERERGRFWLTFV